MNTQENEVLLAYKKLKQYVYYNKNDLHLRKKLSDFEASPRFDKEIAIIEKDLLRKNGLQSEYFSELLNEIDFRISPKSILLPKDVGSGEEIKASEDDGTYISNISTNKNYEVESVSYFFNGPIQLHILCTLWLMTEGVILDRSFGRECFGARLIQTANGTNGSDGRLFKKYHDLYSSWRDKGIKQARHILENEQENVAIIGMDIKTFFYSCDIDFKSLNKQIDSHYESDGKQRTQIGRRLLRYIEIIHRRYNEKLRPYLEITHVESAKYNAIPLGLPSSPVIANWYLTEFDEQVISNINPIYYGRYIDDILLVIKDASPPKTSDPVGHFINKHFVSNEILSGPMNNAYRISCRPNLELQQKKCILQYFDASHSIASLEKFQKKIENNGSDILLLSVEDEGSSLSDVAYDLLYNGSTNKFRSIKGVAENRFELSKYIAKKTIDYILTGSSISKADKKDLLSFFKGKNAIEFHDIWEKVFALYEITGASSDGITFRKSLIKEISRILLKSREKNGKDSLRIEIESKIKADLIEVLEAGIELAKSMRGHEHCDGVISSFRIANMIRHHLVPLPISCYLDFDGDLFDWNALSKASIDPKKIDLSPRFINFDEYLTFYSKQNPGQLFSESFSNALQSYEKSCSIPIAHEIEYECGSHQ